MKGNLLRAALGFSLAAMVSTAASAAGPAKTPAVENLTGQLDLYSQGRVVFVNLSGGSDGAVDRLFRVEVEGQTGPLPSSFRSDSADVVFWKGHLVVIAPREGKAFHFSVLGFGPKARPTDDTPGREYELKIPARGADSFLASRYDLTRIDTAMAIISDTPAGARHLDVKPGEGGLVLKDDPGTIYFQDDGPPGVGTCGSSCSTTCRDGSSCTATCGTNRCARCSCPASCTCT